MAKKESWWRGKAVIYYDKSNHQLGIKRLSCWEQLKWKFFGLKPQSPTRDYNLDIVISKIEDAVDDGGLLNSVEGARLIANRYLKYHRRHSPYIMDCSAFARTILNDNRVQKREKAKQIILTYFKTCLKDFEQLALRQLEEKFTRLLSGIETWQTLFENEKVVLNGYLWAVLRKKETPAEFDKRHKSDIASRVVHQIFPKRNDEDEMSHLQRIHEVVKGVSPFLLSLYFDGKSPAELAKAACREYFDPNSFESCKRLFGECFTAQHFIRYLSENSSLFSPEIKEECETYFENKRPVGNNAGVAALHYLNLIVLQEPSASDLLDELANENGAKTFSGSREIDAFLRSASQQ